MNNNPKQNTKQNIKKQKKPSFQLKPACAAVLLAFSMQYAEANPIGGTVVSGQASFNSTGSALTVTNTPGTIINWQAFSIQQNEITRFAQQSASSTVLNRVITNNPSNILGTLQSNGRVFLVNPNGIVFGQGSTVDVAGLVATTLNLSNADFLAGRLNFTQVPGAQNISNAGNITAQSGGEIYLIAPNVENSGVITAPNGDILLAAGHEVQLVNSNDPNLRVSITAPAGDATNLGQLIVESGSLGLFGTVVRNSGVASADSATMQGGKIVFRSSQRTEVGGTVSATGATGGTIEALSSNEVQIVAGATLDASGANGGGTILVGGDKQGANANVVNALTTYVDAAATIKADAIQNGDGGKVIVWADNVTHAHGDISAQGGANGGNGGFVETSAHYLDVAGIRVDASAQHGKAGEWLLDPADVIISLGTTAFMTTTVGGAWGPLANTSYVDTGTIEAALNLGTSVTITTANPVLTGGGNISVWNSVAKTAGTSATLTLLAENNIDFSLGAGISSTVGALNLVLHSDSDGSGVGTVTFGGTNTFSLLGGRADLYYNPVSYTDAAAKSDSLTNPYSAIFGATPHTAWMLVNDVGLETGGTLGLQAMSTNLAGNYALGKDFTAATSLWNAGAGFAPVGNISTPFTGKFEGLGHTINGLFINRPATDYVGLFGYTNASTIKNVLLTNVNISGNSYVGSLVGWHQGTLTNSSNASGTVTGTMDAASLSGNSIGGLVGMNYNVSTIDNCSSGSTVSGDNYVGGLVGTSQSSTISNSSASGAVTGTQWYVGGLVGDSYITNITNGTANGNVVGVSYVGGLLGRNGYLSTITNGVASGNVTSTLTDAGGLVGFNANTIGSSHATGNVNGVSNVGGLVGNNNGAVSNSYAYTGTVTGTSNVGGLVGQNYFGTISTSNTGDPLDALILGGAVTGNSNVGGLVGYNDRGSISTGYATGSVVGSGVNSTSLGGLVGYSDGVITNSYVTTVSVSGSNNVGGLVGNNVLWVGYTNNISGSYVSGGSVTGTSNVGGLVGSNTGTLTNSHYNITAVTINGANIVTLGGLYNDSTANAQGIGQYSDWLIGKALNIADYTVGSGGSSFGNGGVNIYTTSNANNAAAIQGLKDMLGFADNPLYTFTLTRNVDLISMPGFYVPELAGTFNGAGFTVSNLNLNILNSNLGLFGRNSGAVSNVALVDANVTGGNNVGALAGWNQGTINNSSVGTFSVGGVTVSGAGSVGGLVGNNAGSITNSSVNAGVRSVSVTGINSVGGLVGTNSSSISTSFATGATVAGANNIGGLVGNNTFGASITNSYVSSGAVTASVINIGGLIGNDGGTRTNSYFNIDTVTTNGGNNVTVAGLYATQYNDWFNAGALTPLAIGNYSTSLMISQVDGSYGISDMQGMKDMLGFADDPAAYNFSLMSPNINLIAGYYVPKLAGDFNGKGFTLSNLSLTLPNYDMGLFGVTNTTSLVSNLSLTNARVNGYANVGGLVGRNFGNIDNVAVGVNALNGISAVGGGVGGLVGQNYGGSHITGTGTTAQLVYTGNISNSYVNGGTVSSSNADVGGLVGYNNWGNINLSGVTNTAVSGTSSVGGLVGNNRGSTSWSAGSVSGNISNSFVSGGSVTSTGGALNNAIGGLVGRNFQGDISSSYVLNPTVNGGLASMVGGLVGSNTGGFHSIYQGPSLPSLNVYPGAITTSYVNGGTVSSTGNDVGGLVGNNFGALIDFSHVDAVNVTGKLNVGGLVGYDGGEGWGGGVGRISNSHALNTQVTGESRVGGLIGNVVAPAANSSGDNLDAAFSSYVSGGTVTSNATSSASAPGIGGLVGYNGYGNISSSWVTNGTVVNGGNASDVGGLVGYNIGSSRSTWNGTAWVPAPHKGIVSNSHVNGVTVSGDIRVGGLVGNNASFGLNDIGYIDGSYALTTSVTGRYAVGGLVGSNDGSVTNNSYVINPTVIATSSSSSVWAGGLVGRNYGSISNSYVSGGTVSALNLASDVGGLVGNNSGSIDNGYASGVAVSASSSVGGLVGDNSGSISNSYVGAGTVTGSSRVGGLVGHNVFASTSMGVCISGGCISNSYVSGGTVTGLGIGTVGGLVGRNDGSLVNTYVNGGGVSGASNVGGLVGYNLGSVDSSHTSGNTVTGTNRVGGMVGYNFANLTAPTGAATIHAGYINNSYVSGGTVNGGLNTGGLVGMNYGSVSGARTVTVYAGSISNSFVENTTVAGTDAVGGFAGSNSLGLVGTGTAPAFIGTINNSYTSGGSVTSNGGASPNFAVGGFVGNNNSNIADTYSVGGTVTSVGTNASRTVGGFVGWNNTNGTISNSYSSNGVVAGNASYAGGFAGWNSGTTTADYWDNQTSGIPTIGSGGGGTTGITGLSTAQMMGSVNFTGFDFTNTWWMAEGSTRPFLRSEWTTNITNAHQLQLIGMNATTLSASYTLANNIDLAPALAAGGMWNTDPLVNANGNTGFVPIGATPMFPTYGTPFSGQFNGQNFTISNLTINRPLEDNVGLFGYVGYGSISNVGLLNVNVTGKNAVGGLAGYLGNLGAGWTGTPSIYVSSRPSTISNSYVSGGTVSGSTAGTDVGGLVGNSYGSTIDVGFVENLVVTGGLNVGGLVGNDSGEGWNFTFGTISNSHALNTQVTGTSHVGGLIGRIGAISGGGNPNYDAVFNSFVDHGTVTSNAATTSANAIGGLVGFNSFGNITSSYVTNGTVVNGGLADNVGGLVGYNIGYSWTWTTGFTRNGFISGSFVSGGTVSGMGNVGGLVGLNDNIGPNKGYIEISHVTGTTVNGAWYVGGLVGGNYGDINGSDVTNAIVNGSSSNVGGLAGYNQGYISNNFVSGGSVSGSSRNVGGLVGNNNGIIGGSYVTGGMIVSGVGDVGGMVGRNTGLITNSHFNVDAVTTNGGNNVTAGGLYATQFNDWYNGGLLTPLLISNYAGSLVQQVDLSYGINSLQGMKDMLAFADDPAYFFTLTAPDINLSTLPGFYVPVLAGSFNGAGNTVSNLALTLPNDNLGLFGEVLATGSVSNLGVLNASVSGNSRVGGLVGSNNGGTISNSYVSVFALSGNTMVGGLVGRNFGGLVDNSFVSNGSVSGGWSVGGLVGADDGDWGPVQVGVVSNSHALNTSVTGNSNVGGLVGFVGGGNPVYDAVSYSYVEGGTVTSNAITSGNAIGGLVGYNSTNRISNSYVTNGSVNGGIANSVGGLVGTNLSGIISKNYVNATIVSGNNSVGGLVGANFAGTGAGGGVGYVFAAGVAGVAGSAAVISQSFVSGGTVSGVGDVGGLVGRNQGGRGGAGGMGFSGLGGVGGAGGAATISDSYVNGVTVNATTNAGGLVGANIGGDGGGGGFGYGLFWGTNPGVGGAGGIGGVATISTSYSSSGAVTGTTNVGGLIGNNVSGALGLNDPTPIYGGLGGTGGTGDIANSFWSDPLVTGIGSNTGTLTGTVVGLDAIQMTTMSTFANAGWNIANTGGAGMTWRIYEGQTGPLLTGFLTQATVTANNANKTYDGFAYSGGNGVTASVVAVGGGTLLGGTYGGTSQGAVNVQAGGYVISASGVYSDQLGYDIIGYTDGTLTIDPKVVALTGTKIYDGTAVFTGGTDLFVNTGVGSETLVLTGTASTLDKNVGNTDLLSGASLGLTDGTNGGLASNYTLTGVTLTGVVSIGQATLSLNAVADSKTYDGLTTSAGVVTFSNLMTGDSVTASQSFDSRNAGTRSLGVDAGYVVNDGNGGLNYFAPTLNTAAGSIGQATLSLNAVADSKTYDGLTTSAGVVTFSNLMTGDSVTASQSFDSRNAGTRSLGVDAGYVVNDGNGGLNYFAPTLNTAAGSIGQATLSLNAVADSKTYDGLTTSAGVVTFSNLMTGDSVTASQSFDSRNAGTRSLGVDAGYVVNDGNGGLNYFAPTLNTAAGSIGQATLSLNAVADSKTYDGLTTSAGVVTFSNLMTGDSVTASQSFDSRNAGTRSLGVDAGYVVNDGNGGLNYFAPTLNTAAGSIGQATLSLNAVADSKTYDGLTTSAGVVTFSNLMTGDSVTASQSFDSRNAGTRSLGVDAGYVVNDGNGGLNYFAPTLNTAAGSIGQLASVAWVGGSTGNWSSAANWAGGAIPDGANVLAVSIPVGVTATYDAGVGNTTLDTLTNLGAIDMVTGNITVNGALTQAGTINVATGAVLSRPAGFTNSGTLSGTGTIVVGTGAAGLTNQGNINPGGTGATGTLTISGDLQLSTGANLNMELGGTAAGLYDVLAVSGALTGNLGSFGSLTLTETGGFLTLTGNSFQLIAAASFAPATFFSNVPMTDVEQTIYYYPTNITLVASGVVTRWNTDLSGNWATPANWTRGLPGATDNAVIDRVVANPVITLNTTDAVNSLFVGTGDTLDITGGSLTLNGVSSFTGGAVLNQAGGTLTVNSTLTANNFNFTSGTLGGAGAVTLTGAGTWSQGTMSGTGSTIVASGASLTMGAAGLMILDTRTLVNNGTVTLGTNTLELWNSGVLNNAGTFDLTADNTIQGSCCYGSGSITNTGTFQKTGGTAGSTIGVAFNNGGIINATTGPVTISGAFNETGAGSVGAGTLNLGGGGASTAALNVGTGATVNFTGGTQTLSTAAAFTGLGTYGVTGGILTVDGTLTSSGLNISGGTLGGAGAVTLTGAGTWSQGTMSGTGSTIVASGASLTMGAAGLMILDTRTLVNNGTVTLGTNTLELWNSGVLNNAGTFDLTADNTIQGSCCYGSGSITNTGTFQKTGGTAGSTIGVAFNNGGIINATTGPVTISGAFNETGAGSVGAGTLNLGGGGASTAALNVGTGATVNFTGGTQTLSTAAAFTGLGTYGVTGGILTVDGTLTSSGLNISGGTLGGAGAVTLTGAGTWSQGTMSGTGSTIVASGASLTMGAAGLMILDTRTLVNNGTVTLGTNTLELWNSGVLNNAGTFDLTADNTIQGSCCYGSGSITNTGTFQKTGGTAGSTIGVAFNNGGIINVNSGTLSVNNTFTQSGSINTITGTNFSVPNGFINLGTLSGTGTFTVGIGAAGLINQGVISPAGTSATGTLTIIGDLQLSTGSILNTELGGTAAGQFDTLAVTGVVTGNAASFGGLSLSRIGGYAVAAGDTFQLMTAASGINSGTFASLALQRIALTPTYGAGSFTLGASPMVITITADVLSKIYGSIDPSLTFVATGFDATTGDTTATALSGLLGRAAGANVGVYAINQGALFSPLGYAINIAPVNFSITPKALGITGSSVAAKTYNGDAIASITAGTLSGLVGTETLGVSGSGSFNSKDVLTANTVAANYLLADGTGLAGNYSLAGENLAATISAKALGISGSSVAAKTYNGDAIASVTAGTLSGLVGTETLGVSGSGSFNSKDVLTANTVAANYLLAGTGLAGNYSLAGENLAATISAKGLSITGFLAADKMYDGNQTAVISNAGALNGIVGSEVVTFSYTDATFNTKDVATANLVTLNGVSLTGADNANYSYSAPTIDASVISAKGLTVTAYPQLKYEATADPLLTYMFTGLVGSDTLSGSLSRVSGESVGNYQIQQGALTAGPNYTMTFNHDFLSILATPTATPDVINAITETVTGAPSIIVIASNDSEQKKKEAEEAAAAGEAASSTTPSTVQTLPVCPQ